MCCTGDVTVAIGTFAFFVVGYTAVDAVRSVLDRRDRRRNRKRGVDRARPDRAATAWSERSAPSQRR